VSSSTYDRSNGLTGWSMFSAIWLVIAGAFNLVSGLTSIHQANNISSAFLFQNLKFWGWVLLIVAIVQLFAGFMVFSGNPSGYMLGVLVASFAMFMWFFFLFTAPLGAMVAVIINGLVIYGLTIGSES
jgi:hypothetical protein